MMLLIVREADGYYRCFLRHPFITIICYFKILISSIVSEIRLINASISCQLLIWRVFLLSKNRDSRLVCCMELFSYIICSFIKISNVFFGRITFKNCTFSISLLSIALIILSRSSSFELYPKMTEAAKLLQMKSKKH